MHDESTALLRRYARDRSEAAFRELVQQHSGVVYGTALRQLDGDRAAAQDVMQEVFTLLVRKAPGLGDVVLSAWLYRQTCRRAANHLRTETRRRKRELLAVEAMSSSSPASGDDSQQQQQHLLAIEIDRALLTLSSPDRNALVLRFFENRNFRRVGETLGIGEEAARKRVTRALEKLTLSLKRRGILVTAATSLGSTMTGMAAARPPAAVISQVAAHAVKAAPAAVSTTLGPLLKSFAAGVVVAFLAAAAVEAFRSSPEWSVPTTQIASVPRASTVPVYLEPVATGLSPQDLIAQIKRLESGPSHALTTLRLGVLLDSLPVADIAGFIDLADGQFTWEEKLACYEPLLTRWFQSDPAAAMDYALDQKIDSKIVMARSATKIVDDLFEKWVDLDLAASRRWLAGRWADPNLAEGHGSRSTRGGFLATKVACHSLDQEGLDAALAGIRSIPSASGRWEVLASLAFTVGTRSDSPVDQRLELYRQLIDFPGFQPGGDAACQLLVNWVITHPADISELSKLAPSGQFTAALTLLNFSSASGASLPDFAGGTFVTTHKGSSFKEMAEITMRTGAAVGLSPGEIIDEIAKAGVQRQPAYGVNHTLLEWLDLHRDQLSIDDSLAARAASESTSGNQSPPDTAESVGIEWASRISDPELRLRLCRGIFRTMTATQSGSVAAYVQRPELPADLQREFQAILSEAP